MSGMPLMGKMLLSWPVETSMKGMLPGLNRYVDSRELNEKLQSYDG